MTGLPMDVLARAPRWAIEVLERQAWPEQRRIVADEAPAPAEDPEALRAALLEAARPENRHLRLPALTVLQPYGSALIAGVKPWENRPWALQRLPRWVIVHAGKTMFRFDSLLEQDVVRDAMRARWTAMPRWTSLPASAVLGAVCFDEVVWIGDSTPSARAREVRRDWWACGPCCWHVSRVVELPRPLACRGYQGLWWADVLTSQRVCAAARDRFGIQIPVDPAVAEAV